MNCGQPPEVTQRTHRAHLVETIKHKLVPMLRRLGFEPVPLTPEEKRSEIGAAFPFGRLHRSSAAGFDLVEIQLDKDREISFRLNLARVPSAGIEHAVGHVKAEDVWVHYLDHFCELYSNRFLRRWFAIRKPLDDHSAPAEIEALVERAVTMLDQVETYFASGRAGRNMRCI